MLNVEMLCCLQLGGPSWMKRQHRDVLNEQINVLPFLLEVKGSSSR